MAFVDDPNQNQDDELLAGQTPTTGGGTLVGGGVGGDQAATAGGSPRGSGFVNIRDFLQANQQQGQGLVENIAGDIETQRQGFLSNVQGAGDEFRSFLDQNNPLDTSIVDRAASRPETLTGDEITDFQRLFRGEFRGPGSLEGSEGVRNLRNSFTDLLSRSDLTGSESGREQLLTGFTETPTTGQLALDQLLLQNTPGAGERFQSVRDTVKGTESAIGDAVSQSKADAQARQDALRRLSGDIKERFFSGFGTQPSGGVAPVNVRPGGNVNQGILAQLQGDVNARNTAINRAARDFLSPFFEGTGQQNPFSDFTASQTSGADAFAREAALENLLGQQFDILGGQGGLSNEQLFNVVAGIAQNAPDRPRRKVKDPNDFRGFSFVPSGPERPSVNAFRDILASIA